MAAKSRQDLLNVLTRTMDPNWIEPILGDPDSSAPVNAAADALVLLSGEAQVACDNTMISTSAAGRGGTSSVTLSRAASGTHGTIPQGYTFTDSRGLVASSLGPTTVGSGVLTVAVLVQTQRRTELVNTITDPGYSIAPNLAVADTGGTNALVGQSPAPSGYPTIASTTFTVVASSTPIQGGASDWLSAIGRERGQLRQSGEQDDAYRLRVRNVPDAISPVAVTQGAFAAASQYNLPPPATLEPFNDGADQSVRDNYGLGWFDVLYLSGAVDGSSNTTTLAAQTDFMEDIQPDATNHKVRETVSLREASCYFREVLPGPEADPDSERVFFDDDGYFDDPALGYLDVRDDGVLSAALFALWEECNRKRAAGVRFDEYIDVTTRVTEQGATTSASPTVVWTATPPAGMVWWLRDGHFGWDAPTVPTSASASLVFTFDDASTYTTPAQANSWAQRVIGPLGLTSSRITQVQGMLTSDGTTNASLVGNLVVLAVV